MTRSLGIYKYQSEKCAVYFSAEDMMFKRLNKYTEFIEEFFMRKQNKGYKKESNMAYFTKILEGKQFLDNLILMLQNQYSLSIDITYRENIFASTNDQCWILPNHIAAKKTTWLWFFEKTTW